MSRATNIKDMVTLTRAEARLNLAVGLLRSAEGDLCSLSRQLQDPIQSRLAGDAAAVTVSANKLLARVQTEKVRAETDVELDIQSGGRL